MSTVNCPACEESLELDDAYRDWTVRCPHCGREFVPSAGGRDPRDQPESEDDDGYVYGYAEQDRQEALGLVSAPAVCVEVCGWGTFVLTGLACLLLALAGVDQQNNGGGDGEGLFFLSCCTGVALMPYSLVMALGGRHMRRLTSRGWALTAAILGVVAIPLTGCFGALHGALGIWALVVIEKPVVRRAFGLPNPNRRQWDD